MGIGYFILISISNYVGWYGYEKWKYRVGTDNIQISKKRNVFVKELNYKIVDGKNLNDFKFTEHLDMAKNRKMRLLLINTQNSRIILVTKETKLILLRLI